MNKRLKGWPGWALLAVVLVGLLAFGATRDSGPRTQQDRVDSISKRLACPQCDGETVYESRAGVSEALREDIRRQVADGVRSDDEIVASILAAYGERVRVVPKASGFDSLVWILPVAAFVLAGAGLVVAFRRWKRAVDTVPTDADRELVAAALAAQPAEPVEP